MKKSTIALLCLSVSALGLGCKGSSSTTTGTGAGGVAVVDLDRVAKAMGWNEEMQKNINETKTKVGEQLQNYLKPAQDAVKTKREDILKTLPEKSKDEFNNSKPKNREDLKALGMTDKQIDDLAQTASVAQNEGAVANERFQQIVQAQTNEIVKRYVEAVKPAVRRVAIAGNKAIVLMPNANLLYNDSASDITDLVIDDMQHSPTTTKIDLPPPPTLKFEQPPAPAPSSSTPAATPSATPSTPAPSTPAPTTPSHTRPPTPPPASRTATPSSDSDR